MIGTQNCSTLCVTLPAILNHFYNNKKIGYGILKQLRRVIRSKMSSDRENRLLLKVKCIF